MRAKLIRINEPRNGLPWYFREYVYECIDCGKHYTRNSRNRNISPYCGQCQKKYDAEKDRARQEKKLRDQINAELREVRQEIIDNPILEGMSYGSYDVGVRQKSGFTVRNEVIAIIDKHIEEE